MGIGDWLKEQKAKTSAGIKQFANKDFMEAVAAGCAMIASADGNISSDEKQKMVGYINLNDSLKDCAQRLGLIQQILNFNN